MILPFKKANYNMGQCMLTLQSFVATEELARKTCARFADTGGGGNEAEQVLREHLMYAIEHGAKAPKDRNGV